ncbi:MAG TPA: MBG domain-containing protein, partial [Rhodocyclaceae bacterium]|nr:MBG domain-containing protein [Rhodocyclaceae bacterium]
TAGSALDGSGATNTASLAPRAITVAADNQEKTFGETDPALTYRITQGTLLAGDSLGSLLRDSGEAPGTYAITSASLHNGNYAITAFDGMLTIVPPTAPPPPPAPIIVPAFIDNGTSALATGTPPASFGGLNYVPAGGQAAAPRANGAAPGGATPSTLNFVSGTPANPGSAPADPAGGTAAGGAGPDQRVAAGSANESPAAGRSTLNFVAGDAPDARSPARSDARTDAADRPPQERSAPTAAENEVPLGERTTVTYVSSSASGEAAAGTEAGKRKAAQELNVNNVTVPSSSGPLDVFVIDSGINPGRSATLQSLTN